MKRIDPTLFSLLPASLLRARARQKTNEPLFKRVFASNIIGLCFSEIDGLILEANDEFLKIVGYDRRDLEQGRINWRRMTPDEHKARDEEKIETYLRTGFIAPYEKKYIRKDGALIDVVVGAAKIEGMRPSTGVTYVLDVTKRNRAEEELRRANLELDQRIKARTNELREANQFLDSVLENIPHGIIVKDSATFRIVRVNRAAEKLIGRSREEIIGKDIYSLLPKDQADRVTADDRSLVSNSMVVDNPEIEIAREAIPPRYVRTRRMPLFSPAGELRYILVIAEDLTETKLLEQERLAIAREQGKREDEAKSAARIRALWEATATLSSSLDFQTTLKSMAEAVVPALADLSWVIIKNDDGSIKVILSKDEPGLTDARQQLLQKYPPSLDGTSLTAKVYQSGQPQLIVDMSENIEVLKRAATNPEHEALLRALQMRSFICVPLNAFGRVVGILGLAMTARSGRNYSESDLQVVQTLAERAGIAMENAKLYESAQRANRVKDDFLATLSHELRTPLNVILGNADLLASESATPDEIKHAISAIDRNVKLQAQIVSDLIDVSSVMLGKLSFKPQTIMPIEILKNAIENSESAAKKRGVVIEAYLDYGGMMDADPLRIQQITWNLLTNAVKFTPAGGKVTVSFRRTGDRCILQVEDTGKGISPAFLPYVFEPFRQEDSSLKREYGGLGLGLSIVKSLTELHSGSVKVESAGVDRGATFTVTLPVRQVTAQRDLPTAQNIRKEDLDLHGLTILVVEDSDDSRFLVKRFLERAGAKVQAVPSAKDGLACLAQQRFDAIVSDISMPEMDGFEFIKTWRQIEARNHIFVPAAALTAYTRDEERAKAYESGFQFHIKKPAQATNLVKSVHDLVSRQWH